jgi:hypothetical protein
MSTVLFSQMFVVFVEIAIGYICAKTKVINDSNSKFMSDFVMKVLLPCSILSKVNMEGGSQTVINILLSVVITLVFYIITTFFCLFYGKKRGYSSGKMAVFTSASALPNCGFIGIPLVSAVVGEGIGVMYAIGAMTAYNIWMFTYVEHLYKPNEKASIKKFITPTNISSVLFLVLLGFGIKLPETLISVFSGVGGCTTPIALIIVGVMLADSDIKALFINPFVYLITALRGIIFPVIFMFYIYVMHLDATMSLALTAVMSCPAGSLTAIIAKQVGVEENLASQAVAHSTLFMVVTVPLVLMLATRLFPIG